MNIRDFKRHLLENFELGNLLVSCINVHTSDKMWIFLIKFYICFFENNLKMHIGILYTRIHTHIPKFKLYLIYYNVSKFCRISK
ncbi:hypothetical protein PUN28_014544 [Cardiocondyla obscurior]|uniref:Uncharacterized protein n=1 Tax=Cardiocondyla obscurior TaxID=286306 RepID=A0AAW2F2U2_9HYME